MSGPRMSIESRQTGTVKSKRADAMEISELEKMLAMSRIGKGVALLLGV